MFNIWTWLIGISGFSAVTLIGAILAAWLAPAFFAEFIRPWGKLLGDGTSYLVRKLFSGLGTIAQKMDTIYALVVLLGFVWLGTALYYKQQLPSKGEVCISRVDYKVLPRTTAEKQSYLKKIGKSDTYSWVRSWF